MADPKFTKGPWKPGRPDMLTMCDGPESYGKSVYLDRDDDRMRYHQVTGDRLPLVVAEARGCDADECLANAHLIAAAPALFEVVEDGAFEATEKALRALMRYDDELDPDPRKLVGEALYELEAWGQKADAALALARGEEVKP